MEANDALFTNKLRCSILDFMSAEESVDDDKRKAKTEEFIRFVDQSLNSQDIIKSFNLVTDNKTKADDLVTAGWICRALHKHVEDLTLRVINAGRNPIIMPSKVFSADWIKRLSLIGDRIAFPPLLIDKSCSVVNLSSLTVLSLSQCNISRDEQLRHLLHGCPILRELYLLHCHLPSQIDISNNPNLEILRFLHQSRGGVKVRVRVRAPKLKQLFYLYLQHQYPYYNNNNCHPQPRYCFQSFPNLEEVQSSTNLEEVQANFPNLEVQSSPNLKRLTIASSELDDDLFHKLLTQFPLLESLRVRCLDMMSSIRISNPLLKSIYIENPKDKLQDVVIDCNNLSLFKFCQRLIPTTLPTRPSIRINNPPHICVAKFSVPHYEIHPTLYLHLKHFLTVPQPIFTHLKLKLFVLNNKAYSVVAETENETKHLPSSACEIEELKLSVYGCSSSILNGLLSACHPTTIKLRVTKKDLSSVKLIYEEFANIQGNCKCCCKDNFKCWKHQLKDVKIAKISNIKIEGGALDWNMLNTVLPTLKGRVYIFFRLWW